MTSLALAIPTPARSPHTQMDSGQGLDLFTTGSAPAAADMMTGGGLDLFTTGSAPSGRLAATGHGLDLYTTSC
jgi:hypothetical protein